MSLPFGALIVLIGLWSAYWFATAHMIETRITQSRSRLEAAGYHIAYQPFRIQGYPFRMYAALKGVSVIAPDGRGLDAPDLEAEANAYALNTWVIVAKDGVVWHRGRYRGEDLGAISITAKAIRASIKNPSAPVPEAALELVQPVFKTPCDDPLVDCGPDPRPAKYPPFPLKSADRFEAYVRPSAKYPDSADFLWRVSGAHGVPGTLAGRVGHESGFDWHIEGRIDNISKLKTLDGAKGLDQWKASGGVASDLRAAVQMGRLNLQIKSPALGLDKDGALRGSLNLEISGQGDALGLLSDTKLLSKDTALLAHSLLHIPPVDESHPVKLDVEFREGGTWYGLVRLSDAPHIP